MAENNLQNQKNEVSFVLSDKAKAIIEKFEEKLQAGKYTAEQKNGIRAELVWQLLAKNYPETVCKVEETMAVAENEKQNVESPLEGLVSQFRDSPDVADVVILAMGLFDLYAIRLQIPICDLVDAEQIEALSKETPAVVDHYFYAIVKYDAFKDSNDRYPELCIRLSSDVRNMRMLCRGMYREVFHSPLSYVFYFFKRDYSVLNKEFDLVILDENEDTSKCGPSTIRLNGAACSLQDFVTNHLTSTGRLFYKAPATCINEESWLSFRKWVVENKFLHGVIQLSEGQILVISKQPVNSILFFDARKDFVKDNKLDVDKLIEAIQEKTSEYYIDVPFVDFVSYNSKCYTFIDRPYAQRFVPTPKEGDVLVPLRDLVDLYESEVEEDVSCYFLNRAYYITTDLWENLETVTMPWARRVPNDKFFLFRWDEFAYDFSCAYQSKIDDGLFIDGDSSTGVERPYDYYTQEPIICTYPNSIIFKLKETPAVPIDPYYLAKLLFASREVYAQLECYKLPFGDCILEKEDFLSIVVAVPTMEEQQRILNLDRLKALAETKEEIKKNYEAYKRDIRMKKHALAQRLRVMKDCWQYLQKAREEGNGIVNDEAVIGKLHPISVKKIYSLIDREINMLFKQVSAFNLGDTMTPEMFDVKEFVQQYMMHLDPIFKYQYELPKVPANIYFPKDALQIILDNIVSNACSHGFKGRENKSNIIRILMEIKRDDLIVQIGNNGNPMSPSMTAERVFTYGDTTEEGVGEHGGLGGFQIKDLMLKFGNDVELELDENVEFPVVYKLVFRDVNIRKNK